MSLATRIAQEFNNVYSHVSAPAAYHIYNGSVEATNTILTNGFSTTLYTGNGGTQAINTGVDMATQWGDDASEMFGGLVWFKGRNVGYHNYLYDTTRGSIKEINTNTTEQEETLVGSLSAFSSTGFSVGSSIATNAGSTTYASWNFQTTHRVTGTTNHGKAYTCHYNPYTGFTIVKYEGSGLAGHEIPHHLGRKLGFATVKNLSTTDGWVSQYRADYYLNLHLTSAEASSTIAINAFGNDNTTINTGTAINASSNQYILYGWANSYFDEDNTLIGNYEIGVYKGTGVVGNKVPTRGKPAWVMIKRLDGVGGWFIFDNQRKLGYYAWLLTDSSQIEYADRILLNSLDSNGFTLGSYNETNASGGQYLYMVVYDNDSGSGKSKYPKATDTTNLSINALVPYANGIDVNGSKVSIEYKNETITGLTLIQGKNYVYSKNDGTYGVSKYKPMYGSLIDRSVAGENPDYFDLKTMKWYGTSGNELVTNGTFDTDTSGWTAITSTLSIVNNTLRVTVANALGYGGAYNVLTNLVVGKKYRYKLSGSLVTATQFLIRVGVPPFSNGYDYQSAWQTSSGVVYLDFVALYTTMAIEFTFGATNGVTGSIDNVSVFPVEPTIGAEITPRTYLDCVVYADQNGQVSYVEELPKTTHITNLKVTDGFDLGQTWQDVTASRRIGVTYTNNTGRPIEVNIGWGSQVSDLDISLYVDSKRTREISYNTSAGGLKIISATIPNESTYLFRADTSGFINLWLELR